MRKPLRLASAVLLLLFAGLFLAGCSGLDDLRVVNNYPFVVSLYDRDGRYIGEVPAQTTCTFDGEGGYNGSGIDGIHVEAASHKLKITLNHNNTNVDEQDKRANGSSTWNVTLGPPPASLAVHEKPAPPGWIVAGFAFFIGVIEWRAHKNEKTTRFP